MNLKTLSRSNDSPSSTKNEVNDDLSSSSNSSNYSNRNHEIDNDNNWENEALVGEVDVFESSFLDETPAFSTSFVVSLSSSVATRTRKLKKLNVNIII